jgi:FdhD protein
VHKRSQSTIEVGIKRVGNNQEHSQIDILAVEEPLEIRLSFIQDMERISKSIYITMRTPGNDVGLAIGYLFAEGIITSAEQMEDIHYCGPPAGKHKYQNTIRVNLRSDVNVDLKRIERYSYTSSSCGVCGKTSIEALGINIKHALPKDQPVISVECINSLTPSLYNAQALFATTGGLHAAALFDVNGELINLQEDVGRHNAVDKLIGEELLKNNIPLHTRLIMVSGRASFELVQKALMSGIPILVAVGAPSSLAVELANQFNMTLLGFARDNRFNIYSGETRICYS